MRSFYRPALKQLNFFKSITPILTLVFIATIGSVNAQSVTVSTTVDENNGNTTSVANLIGSPGGAGISIREAVLAANNEPSGSTVNITIPAGNYSVTLTGVDNTGLLGDIDVLVATSAGNKTVNIIGAGAATTIITGMSGERIFEVHSNNVTGSSIAFSITGIKLTGGSPASSSGGAILAGRPGDVTTVTNCIFSNNVSSNAGGALSVSSGSASHNLTVTGCTFTNNRSNGSGGAISFNGSGTSIVNIDQNTFTNNTTTASDGGAINISGTSPGPNLCNITRNTFTGNSASVGGGAAINAINVVTINANYNRIVGNTANAAAGKMILGSGGVITTFNKDNNWWGVNTGPAAADISDVTGTPAANWLQLKSSAATSPICIGATSVVTSGFLSNSASNAVSVANLTPAMIGLPVTFSTIGGTLSSAQPSIQASGTATVTYTAPASGAGSVNAVVDNVAVADPTARASITATANNTVSLTSANGTNNQFKCVNAAITNITYSTTGATGATFSGFPAGVTGSWAANVVTISGAPTTTVGSPFGYTVTLTGGCGSVNASGTITVPAANTVSLTSAPGTNNQTVAVSSPITNITYATTGATGANFSGLPAGVSGAWSGNVVTISGAPTTGVGSPFNYTVTLTGGCETVTALGSITVPTCSISLTSAAGTNAQTKCINTAITNITYATTGATGATFTGLPAGVTGNWAGNVVTISGTPTESGTFSYTVALTGGCGTITAIGTVIVQPQAGDATVFGSNTWNVYAWNAGSGTLSTNNNWNTNYSGYYSNSSLNINTGNDWDPNTSPSNATNYQGCTVGIDNHSYSAKRMGFPCGFFSLDVPLHDDAAQLFVNGTKVWEHNGCCDNHTGVWSGWLSVNDKIEYRITEGGGGSGGRLDFNLIRSVDTSNTAVALCPNQLPYSWNDNSYNTAGTYYAHFSSFNGCDSVAALNLSVKQTTTSDTTVTACNKFSWNGINPTVSGDYIWHGINAAGCDSTATLHLTIIFIANTFTKTDAICYGSATGSVQIDVASSGYVGTPPYTYRLGVTGLINSFTNVFNNLKAGTYRAYVQDANGCIGVAAPIVVAQQPQVSATVSAVNASCNGVADGSITITNPVGNSPFMYKIGSTGSLNPLTLPGTTISNLRAGTYRIYIQDANGCTSPSIVASVQQPAYVAVNYTITLPTCANPTGSISLSLPGNAAGTFKLNPGGNYTSQTLYPNLAAGTYYGYAKDANGCTGRSAAIVLSPATGCTPFARMAYANGGNEKQSFEVSLSPNPSSTQFTLTVFSAKKEAVQVRVMDANGRVLHTVKGLPEQTFKFGNELHIGIYMVEVKQGNEVKTLKAVKIRN